MTISEEKTFLFFVSRWESVILDVSLGASNSTIAREKAYSRNSKIIGKFILQKKETNIPIEMVYKKQRRLLLE